MATLLHGSKRTAIPHIGLCLTDSKRSAGSYAVQAAGMYGDAIVTVVEVDFTDLEVVEVASFDRDDNRAVGDDGEPGEGVDVIVYEDEDYHGQQHTTWRLVSDRALAAVRIIGTYEE